MSTFVVPPLEDDGDWPSLGGQVVEWQQSMLTFGPGDLLGRPYRLDDEDQALIERAYQVYPPQHPGRCRFDVDPTDTAGSAWRCSVGNGKCGRRRFDTVIVMTRKGTLKSERLAATCAVELSADGPVRCDGFRRVGRRWEPVGRPVVSPFVFLFAFAKEQAEDTSWDALRQMVLRGPAAAQFDVWEERMLRRDGTGEAKALATAPDSRDGGKTTFQGKEEPLALDTPVPTPFGWTTMGAIEPGDVVFGSDGYPTRVSAVGPVRTGRECYRVTFGDHSSIVADGLHPWTVFDRSPSYRRTRTVTTEELARYRWAQCARFSLPEPQPLQEVDAELPVDPYVLGLWLGDGDSTNVTITSGHADVQQVEELIGSIGYRTSRMAVAGGHAALLYVTDNDSRRGHTVRARMRDLDLMRNKHIPPLYLRASFRQRHALLQGLMDSDGHVSTPQGQCTFDNTNPRLFADTVELLRTLGYHPTTTTRTDVRWGVPRPIQRLRFAGRRSVNPFRLPRKAERVHDGYVRQFRSDLAIKSVELVESVPVRCITVESSDHLFLAGQSMMPTHNSHRWVLPRQKEAHQTTRGNLSKRPIAEPWEMHATTMYAPGEGSVIEELHDAARKLVGEESHASRMFFFYRWADKRIRIHTEDGSIDRDGLRAAIVDASGPAKARWADVDGIAELQFLAPGADPDYAERVWLNRPKQRTEIAFDVEAWRRNARPDHRIPAGALIVLGFDGSRGSVDPNRSPDTTGLVATEVSTGFQQRVGFWDPADYPDRQIPRQLVDIAMDDAFGFFDVWRLYADPPDWDSEIASWIGRWGKDRVVEWFTWRERAIGNAVANYAKAIASGECSNDGDPVFTAHIGHAHKRLVNARNDRGERLYTIQKEREGSQLKIDLAMAGALSWEARNDAIGAGALNVKPVVSAYAGLSAEQILERMRS